MMTAMTTVLPAVLLLLALAAAFTLLATYARHDHFATPRTPLRDELGPVRWPRFL